MQELTIKQKLTNYYYFVIFNSVLACVIGVGYWLRGPVDFCMPIPKLTDWLGLLYIVTTHFSVITLLTCLVSLVLLPSIYLSPKKSLFIQSVLASLFIGLLIFDVGVFHADNIHLTNIDIHAVTDTLFNKTIMLRANKIIAYIAFIIFIVLIYFTNNWIFKTNWLRDNKIGFWFASLLLASFVISLLTYQITTKEKQQQLLVYMQYLPANQNNNAITNMYKQVKHGKLQYPVKPLQTTKITNPPNILIIAMDAWRADCFNEIDSPNLWQFAKQGIVFNNHFSGSNHTINGLFSLFYSIPSIYYSIILKQQQEPLFIKVLKNFDYQIKDFSHEDSPFNLCINEKDKVRFHKSNITEMDLNITNAWLSWYNTCDLTKPWFSFIFYDSLHGPYFPEDYSTSAKPVIGLRDYKKFANKVGKQGFINSYKISVHYIDSLANQILTQLKQSNDLENTIVIITADHGCEWNDNNQGQWGYWSNFTDCQVKVPLAIILPKQFQNKVINQQDNLTTHYDIVPTLMHSFLGITNNIADYSIGNNLLNNNNTQQWCLACSSAQYAPYYSAIITNDNSLKIFPNGITRSIDNLNRLIFNKTINQDYLDQALEYMTRFIKK